MICRYCSTEHPKEARVCEKCGASLPRATRSVISLTPASLDPAVNSALKPELAEKLEAWSAHAREALCSVHILGKNYPLRELEYLRQLLDEGWIRPDTPVLHQKRGKWFEARRFPGLEGSGSPDPDNTQEIEASTGSEDGSGERSVEGRAVLAARLGREAEEAASAGEYARAIAIYQEVVQINPRYPLVQRRLRQLREQLESGDRAPKTPALPGAFLGPQEERTMALMAEDLVEDELTARVMARAAKSIATSALAKGGPALGGSIKGSLPPPPPLRVPPRTTPPPPSREESTLQERVDGFEEEESTQLVPAGPDDLELDESTAEELAFEDAPPTPPTPTRSRKRPAPLHEDDVEHTLDILLSAADVPRLPASLVEGLHFVRSPLEMDWSEVEALFQESGHAPRPTMALRHAFERSQHVCFAYVDDRLIAAVRALSDGISHGCICDLAISPAFPPQLLCSVIVGALLQELECGQIVLLSGGAYLEALRPLGFLPRHGVLLRLGSEP